MTEVVLGDELMPQASWNTHIACLERLTQAAGHGLDLVDTAGITGLAFRTALTTRVTPPSQYKTWAWAPSFLDWLDALGLDAQVAVHQTQRQTYPAWLERQHIVLQSTLQRGFPVMYWDNVAFGLVIGSTPEGYLVSGVPAKVVHPVWHEQPDAARFCARLIDPREPASLKPKLAPRSCLTPAIDKDALVIHVQGVASPDPEQRAYDSLIRAHAEMTGRVEYPRIADDLDHVYAPRFGTAALERWREELKEGLVHDFGMILAVQALAEARRLGALYLRRLAGWLPECYRARLEQIAAFTERVGDHLRPVQETYDVPLNPDVQMMPAKWQRCRETLYEVMRTEETAGRLLGSIARQISEEREAAR